MERDVLFKVVPSEYDCPFCVNKLYIYHKGNVIEIGHNYTLIENLEPGILNCWVGSMPLEMYNKLWRLAIFLKKELGTLPTPGPRVRNPQWDYYVAYLESFLKPAP